MSRDAAYMELMPGLDEVPALVVGCGATGSCVARELAIMGIRGPGPCGP